MSDNTDDILHRFNQILETHKPLHQPVSMSIQHSDENIEVLQGPVYIPVSRKDIHDAIVEVKNLRSQNDHLSKSLDDAFRLLVSSVEDVVICEKPTNFKK